MKDLFLVKEFANVNMRIKIQKRVDRKDKLLSICSSIGRRIKIKVGVDDATNSNIGYFDTRLNFKGHEYVLSIDLDNSL